ncbi:MAG: hypothetical protein HYX69_10890 [Planctomycetia bacterium]|nr:hypothetical protein [Planctomycetia bacterium]
MTVRAVALLSGGLDSMLAIRILQAQGIEVEALNFRTTFVCCQDQAALAAEELGVRLSLVSERDDYLRIIHDPAHGYGRGANPCVDCRIYMFRLARQWMNDTGAAFVASGEVVGQRPMSQKKRDLAVIAHQAGLDDHLLRPLSARLLPPTAAERSGLVDRQRLHGFSGRGRKELIALARELGLRRIPNPSTGCALTEPQFATKVHDLVAHDSAAGRLEFELLKIGRHVRFDRRTKAIVGRRAAENERLPELYGAHRPGAAALLEPENFSGPTVLVVGTVSDASLSFAGGLLLRYAKTDQITEPRAWVHAAGERSTRTLVPHRAATTAASL